MPETTVRPGISARLVGPGRFEIVAVAERARQPLNLALARAARMALDRGDDGFAVVSQEMDALPPDPAGVLLGRAKVTVELHRDLAAGDYDARTLLRRLHEAPPSPTGAGAI